MERKKQCYTLSVPNANDNKWAKELPGDAVQWLLEQLHILHPNKQKLLVLDNVNGLLQPGRMTLLLGPPASGKSVLLKALAGAMKGAGLKARSTFLQHKVQMLHLQDVELARLSILSLYLGLQICAVLPGQRHSFTHEYGVVTHFPKLGCL